MRSASYQVKVTYLPPKCGEVEIYCNIWKCLIVSELHIGSLFIFWLLHFVSFLLFLVLLILLVFKLLLTCFYCCWRTTDDSVRSHCGNKEQRIKWPKLLTTRHFLSAAKHKTRLTGVRPTCLIVLVQRRRCRRTSCCPLYSLHSS